MSSTIRRVASDPGSFDIVLNTDILPESISGGAREFGTLWVTTAPVEEGARNVCVYGGVVTKISRSTDRGLVQLSGSSLEWHLGTARDSGPVMIGVISLIGPPPVSVGTALAWAYPVVPVPYNPNLSRIQVNPPGSIMGANYQALQTRADYLNIIRGNHQGSGNNTTDWYVNPRTREVEFGQGNYIHAASPILHQREISDPLLPSITIKNASLASDWQDWYNQVVLAGASLSTGTLTITQILPWPAIPAVGSSPYRYATGNDMHMAIGKDQPHASLIGLGLLAVGLLDGGKAPQHTFACTVDHFDPGGPLQAGCRARVWAPEIGMFNPNGPLIEFAGENIWPIDLPVAGVEWSIQNGMGVYWQYGSGEVLDLSPYVVRGDSTATLIVGEWKKKNVPRQSMRASRTRGMG